MIDLRFKEWVKKLGDQHWAVRGRSVTLCGRAMLGSNYAQVTADERKALCEVCAEKKKEMQACPSSV